jgi:hypothetical protein
MKIDKCRICLRSFDATYNLNQQGILSLVMALNLSFSMHGTLTFVPILHQPNTTYPDATASPFPLPRLFDERISTGEAATYQSLQIKKPNRSNDAFAGV